MTYLSLPTGESGGDILIESPHTRKTRLSLTRNNHTGTQARTGLSDAGRDVQVSLQGMSRGPKIDATIGRFLRHSRLVRSSLVRIRSGAINLV
jgi:hypothetical protein